MDERDDVRTELSGDEQALQAQVRESEHELAKLEEDLYSVDVELAQLAGQNRKYEALGEVCRSLEQLDELGGTDLFWKPEAGDVGRFIDGARDRIHDFGEKFIEVEKQPEQTIVQRVPDGPAAPVRHRADTQS